MNKLNWLKCEENGQGIVEYALIIAGIALVVWLIVFALGRQISDLFTSFGDSLPK